VNQLKAFSDAFMQALKNLLPIIVVVIIFQFFVLQRMPDNLLAISIGLFIVAIGTALFLRGLELSIFPVGKSLSNQFTKRGSIALLLLFGFSIGFSAAIAEPALIAIAEQAQVISEQRIDALTLRFLVAVSIGLVVSIGILRIIFGFPLKWLMIGGYIAVISITFFTPDEIIGLAYDSGAVTTSIVTVPLMAAIGIGLAASIRGRNPLIDGFGIVAMAVMVPMITVQLYGIVVFSGTKTAPVTELSIAAAQQEALSGPLSMLMDLLGMVGDVLPIILTILFFQYLVLKRPLTNPRKVVLGFAMVLFGLYAFVVGLQMGLFPIGSAMAEQLIRDKHIFYVYLFAFAIGFATSMAEPALLAIGEQAEEAALGKIKGNILRITAAVGMASGISIGVHRIITGESLHFYMIGGYLVVIFLSLFTPKYILSLAYDLGGVTASVVTVPLIASLGIGLATHIEGRNILMDGFGLIAFASIFPIITVMLYAIATHLMTTMKKVNP